MLREFVPADCIFRAWLVFFCKVCFRESFYYWCYCCRNSIAFKFVMLFISSILFAVDVLHFLRSKFPATDFRLLQ